MNDCPLSDTALGGGAVEAAGLACLTFGDAHAAKRSAPAMAHCEYQILEAQRPRAIPTPQPNLRVSRQPGIRVAPGSDLECSRRPGPPIEPRAASRIPPV